MTKEDAAKVLGSFLGVPGLEPASVLNMDVDQVRGTEGGGGGDGGEPDLVLTQQRGDLAWCYGEHGFGD